MSLKKQLDDKVRNLPIQQQMAIDIMLACEAHNLDLDQSIELLAIIISTLMACVEEETGEAKELFMDYVMRNIHTHALRLMSRADFPGEGSKECH